MDIPASAYPAIATVTAAIIAGGISWVVTVLTKEQKTSEFRQAWIDGLRDDLSRFVSTIDTLTSLLRLKAAHGLYTAHSVVATLEEHTAELRDMGVSHNRILLRLNPKEHGELRARVDRLAEVMLDYKRVLDERAFDELTKAVVEESQRVLKCEWERVKQGEPIYRVTKYVSLAVVAAAVTVAVALGWGYISIGALMLYRKWLQVSGLLLAFLSARRSLRQRRVYRGFYSTGLDIRVTYASGAVQSHLSPPARFFRSLVRLCRRRMPGA